MSQQKTMVHKGYYKGKSKKRSRSRLYTPSQPRKIGRNIFWKRAYNKMSYLARMLNVEYKENTSLQNDTPSTTFTKTLMSGIAQGDTNTTRDGSSCKVVGFEVAGTLTINASATVSYVRVIILIDSQTNGVAFSSTSLLYTATDVNSPYNLNNERRFRILFDKLYELDQYRPGQVFSLKRSIEIPLRFAGATADIGFQTENSIWIGHLSNEATNTPAFDYTFRVMYIDN